MSRPTPSSAQTLRVWDLPTRLFHCLLVGSIAVAFLSSDEDSALGDWHQAAGWFAAMLIVFRLVWGLVGGEHARFAEFLRPGRLGEHVRGLARRRPTAELGHNPLGALAVVGLLGLVAAAVASGVLLLRGGEEDLHEAIAYGLLALVGLHVAAVVVMSFASRENLVRAMVTGAKPAVRHPGGRDAKPAPALALPLAALAVAAAVFGATRIDAQAFTPHPRLENAERGHVGKASEEAREHEAGEREAGG
ncbi:MAG TPA: cytochrome b/b6 domain-containing protein [Phenylobacterium sp.]|nr:cytochrome b/b6 domain-containing protein [Phenylobacterium sp.]